MKIIKKTQQAYQEGLAALREGLDAHN